MPMKKHWPWFMGIAIGLAFLLLPIGAIYLRLHLNEVKKQEILNTLQETYPDTRFQAGVSYETPRVYLRAYGVNDPQKQTEMRDLLVKLKAKRKMSVEIWLRFEDATWDDEKWFFKI